MKKVILILFITVSVIVLLKVNFNRDYYFSGFYKDSKTNRYFYKDFVYTLNDSLNNKIKICSPVLEKNGDTLKNIDIKSFVKINDFFKDDFYVYRIKTKVDLLSVIAEPINEIKFESYFKNSFYEIIEDKIFYNSPSGGVCNDLILPNKKGMFHVLDIDDDNLDCAIFDHNIIIINGCIKNKLEIAKLERHVLKKINFSIKNKIYKKAIEIHQHQPRKN